MHKTTLNDAALLLAVEEMQRGLVDADLGGGVYKKRIPLPGRGKSGGVRTIIATNRGDRWFFIFGFAKNDMENIADSQRDYLQRYAKELLAYPESKIKKLIAAGTLQEIYYEPTH